MGLPSLPTSASDVQASLSTASPAALQSSGDSLMASVTNAAQSTAQSANSNPAAAFAIVAAAAQAVVSGLPPGPATSVMAGAVADATEGAILGGMIGSYIPIIGTAAGGLLGAEVGAEIGAVAAVIPELEADHWNFLNLIGQLAGSGVGAGAAAGAAAGSFVPVIGTGVGALVGSVVGDLAGATNPPLQDCRYLSEKLCFPAVAPVANNADTNADGVFGLIPGRNRLHVPRAAELDLLPDAGRAELGLGERVGDAGDVAEPVTIDAHVEEGGVGPRAVLLPQVQRAPRSRHLVEHVVGEPGLGRR